MSLRPKRCKCRCCSEFFFSDYRNRERQRYCGKPACQQASKSASQRRWLRTPFGRRYFREADNVERVRQWRKAHPGYWKRKKPVSGGTQAVAPESVNPVQVSCNVPRSPLRTLQDFCHAQDPGFIGILAMLTGRTLPDDIVPLARRVIEQGQNILGLTLPEQRHQTPSPVYDRQTSAPSGSVAANPPKL